MTRAPAYGCLPDSLSAPVSAEACQEDSNAGADPDIIALMVSGRSGKSNARARGRKNRLGVKRGRRMQGRPCRTDCRSGGQW